MSDLERALENIEALISENKEPWRDQWASSVLYQTRELLVKALAELAQARESSAEAVEKRL
jgi:hypothetical protein